jgi:hypothetical protein
MYRKKTNITKKAGQPPPPLPVTSPSVETSQRCVVNPPESKYLYVDGRPTSVYATDVLMFYHLTAMTTRSTYLTVVQPS